MFAETYGLTVQKQDFIPFVGAGEDRFIGGVAEKYGVRLTMPRDKTRVYQIYLELIRGRLQPLPGAVGFIATCKRRGLRIAVASSADEMKVDGNLAQIRLPRETFDAVVTGNEVAHKKPDPTVFLVAAERLKLAPQACLVVEDATNGIRAGKAAGARCLGLTTSFTADMLREAGADWIAADLAHVPIEVLALTTGNIEH
jgi:HAD superfamily hydrolase (TIGR01509 family)